jgi:hypothetical protein
LRNVSGYITDDGEFFEDKKKAEAHEKLLSIGKYMDEFIRVRYDKNTTIKDTLQAWERYKAEIAK